MIFLSFKKLLVIILLKNTQSYVSYLAKFWHFSILANDQFFNFFIKFSRTCDTGIKVFCEMAKKAPKSDGIFLILPFVRDPSTSEREHVSTFAGVRLPFLGIPCVDSVIPGCLRIARVPSAIPLLFLDESFFGLGDSNLKVHHLSFLCF